jgi:Domain of unknown function (DUF1707)
MDELRVGDAEREDALRQLGEHLAAGRLDIDEHSERSSRILASRTRGEIRAVFADLPPPHPELDKLPATRQTGAPQRGQRGRRRPSTTRSRGTAVRAFFGELTGVVWIVSIIAMITTGVGWWVLLVPVAYSTLLSAWGRAAGDQQSKRVEPKKGNSENPGTSESSGASNP